MKNFELKYCKIHCGQMTNHIGDECQKCKVRNTKAKYPKNFTPKCPSCHTDFINAWDDFTDEISEYLWRPNCSCYPKDVMISIG